MKYAVVKVWEDNPHDVQVIEYFSTIEEARLFMRKQSPSKDFKWEIMEYRFLD